MRVGEARQRCRFPRYSVAALTLALLLAPAAAWGHGPFGLGPLYAGVAHPFWHVDVLLAVAAVVLWLVWPGRASVLAAYAGYVAGVATATLVVVGVAGAPALATWPLLPWATVITAVAAALRPAVPLGLHVVTATLGGALTAAGALATTWAELPGAHAVYALGLALGLALTTLLGAAALIDVPQVGWPAVAQRVAASWLAAIALMLAALAARTP